MYRRIATGSLVSIICLALCTSGVDAQSPPSKLRAGIIGLDTSHVIAFTKVLNNPDATGPLADVRVVAGFPGGSPDIPSSRDRVAGYTEQLRGMGVEICDSIPNLLSKVDCVLLESVDGRPHLEQARPVIAAGKPLFVDKPMAGTLADVIKIFALAKKANVPCFSSSSLRYGKGMATLQVDSPVGPITGCDAFSPCSLEEHHPDLFWYGVHGVETLFTVMGTGCEQVTRVQTDSTEFVVGVWEDGRVGTFRGRRSKPHTYGALVSGEKGTVIMGEYAGYEPLVVEICKFFKSGKAPVSAAETIEIFAFMEAADQSKRNGGGPVKIAHVIAKARQQAAQ